MRALFFLAVGFLSAFFQPGEVLAGTISIVGSPAMKFEFDGTQVSIKGEFELSNFGDETSIDVFPEIVIGKWRWAGGPQKLNPQGRHRWTFDEKVELSQMACHEGACELASDLGVNGLFPVFVWRHYKDLNGYPFTALTVEKAIAGNVPESSQYTLQAGRLNMSMQIRSKGESFKAEVTVLNNSGAVVDGFLSLHTTKEVLIETKPQKISIPSQSTVSYEFHGKNFSGLLGSVYQVFAVAQYKDGDLRNTATMNAPWTIQEAESTNVWIFLILGFLTVGIIAILYLRRMN
jgi:hypothetical protein